jgi:hypothetical protein
MIVVSAQGFPLFYRIRAAILLYLAAAALSPESRSHAYAVDFYRISIAPFATRAIVFAATSANACSFVLTYCIAVFGTVFSRIDIDARFTRWCVSITCALLFIELIEGLDFATFRAAFCGNIGVHINLQLMCHATAVSAARGFSYA